MNCTHKTPDRWVYVDVYDDWTGETTQEMQNIGGESTNEDIDVGRFRCRLCGQVGYYTGLWRDFYEKGIPCPGSDQIDRARGATPVVQDTQLTDEQCDEAAAQAMDRVAAAKRLHALELNPDITSNSTLRRELVRAGFRAAMERADRERGVKP